MKKTVSIMVSLILAGVFASCKKEEKKEPAKPVTIAAVITYVMGDVTVDNDDGSGPEKAKPSRKLGEYTLVKTGKKSAAFIQIGEDAVIKVLEQSVFRAASVAQENIALEIQSGSIAGKISKLQKSDSFKVKTPTVVASVRGTSFMVAVGKSDTKVVVKEGKMAVASTEAELATAQVASDGETAQVKKAPDGKVTVAIAKSAKDEDKEIINIEKVPSIPQADTKSEDELIKLLKDIAEAGGEKDVNVNSAKAEKQKQIIQKQSATIAEIKEAFSRIDEITLYNNQVISGIILTRGDESFEIVTPTGKRTVAKKDIKGTKVIR